MPTSLLCTAEYVWGEHMTMDWTSSTIGVVGAGSIGTSVAHAVARAGIPVVLHDTSLAALDAAPARIASLDRLTRLRRGAVELAEIRTTGDLETLALCAVVIENIVEDPQQKLELHSELAGIVTADTVVAVNTSAIPIAPLAERHIHPGKVLGAHFMNPAAMIDTVELVRTPVTSEQTISTMQDLLGVLGKTGVVIRDRTGFVINRSLMLFVNEAIRTVAEGVASAREVDQLFRGCLGHRSGPLQTADLIGLDTVLDTLIVLEKEHGSAFTPAAELERLVSAGHLGRKSGRGLYDYTISMEAP